MIAIRTEFTNEFGASVIIDIATSANSVVLTRTKEGRVDNLLLTPREADVVRQLFDMFKPAYRTATPPTTE